MRCCACELSHPYETCQSMVVLQPELVSGVLASQYAFLTLTAKCACSSCLPLTASVLSSGLSQPVPLRQHASDFAEALLPHADSHSVCFDQGRC